MRRTLGILGVLSVLSGGVLTTSCGYTLAGRSSTLPASIKTIGIPLFTNRTTVFNLETKLTEKVRSEFIGRGKFTISSDASGVDGLLTGEVTAVSITPASINANQLASRYAITIVARVELRDTKMDMVIWDNPGLVFRQEYDATGNQAGQTAIDPTAFFGQETNALDRLSTEFARSIVSAILEAF
ncbi:MAG TPA: LPS assembly lipoprotein LptE [Vicinamibacterales bacterium]|nr:LPS assembly lipoprotein LptE [Vicinamibacterales bacterium]